MLCCGFPPATLRSQRPAAAPSMVGDSGKAVVPTRSDVVELWLPDSPPSCIRRQRHWYFLQGRWFPLEQKSEEHSRLAARKYARIVQKLGFQDRFKGLHCKNKLHGQMFLHLMSKGFQSYLLDGTKGEVKVASELVDGPPVFGAMMHVLEVVMQLACMQLKRASGISPCLQSFMTELTN